MKSEFLQWFVEQHGPRQADVLAPYDDQKLQELVDLGTAAQVALNTRRNWDDRRQSALYAWQARETKEPAR